MIYRRGLLSVHYHQKLQKETKYDAATFTIPSAAFSDCGFIRARRYVLFSAKVISVIDILWKLLTQSPPPHTKGGVGFMR